MCDDYNTLYPKKINKIYITTFLFRNYYNSQIAFVNNTAYLFLFFYYMPNQAQLKPSVHFLGKPKPSKIIFGIKYLFVVEYV